MNAIRTWLSKLSDREFATVLGVILLVASGWPLLFLWLPPYQDLPDHLATVSVLLHPERYPDFVSNGWFKANSLFVLSTFLLAKAIGVIPAGRLICGLALAATAFGLPRFVLAMGDRRRLAVASLVMAPMVHHWWILMGMLGFAFAFPLSLWMLVLLSRQSERPTWVRGGQLVILSTLLWLTHAVALLLVLFLVTIEILVRPHLRTRIRAVIALCAPVLPVLALVLWTILLHARETTPTGPLGRAGSEDYQTNGSAAYDLWAHQFFGLSPLSVAGIVPAVALALFGARAFRANAPMFSSWSLLGLGTLYWFLPLDLPGFGYVCERALPLMWAWALVRIPSVLPKPVALGLAVACIAWAVGLSMDLFRAEQDLNDFVAAAPEVPPDAHLLTLNFAPRVSSRNTWSLLHASGMYTVLRGSSPQDVWADSPSMPIRRTHRPEFVEDPVAIRDFLSVAGSPGSYCAATVEAKLFDFDCRTRWANAWVQFWNGARKRYDHVLLWCAPPDVIATIPASYHRIFIRGRLELLAREELNPASSDTPLQK